MEQITIEGTWEEVASRAGELAGHRVRVTVLDAVATPDPSRIRNADAKTPPPATNPVMGMFRDAPDLLDEIVEEAMKVREERPWRLPAGE